MWMQSQIDGQEVIIILSLKHMIGDIRMGFFSLSIQTYP